jgi:hypothetical protein
MSCRCIGLFCFHLFSRLTFAFTLNRTHFYHTARLAVDLHSTLFSEPGITHSPLLLFRSLLNCYSTFPLPVLIFSHPAISARTPPRSLTSEDLQREDAAAILSVAATVAHAETVASDTTSILP